MATTKIIGQYSNAGKDEIEIAAPSLINCYSNDMDSVPKRPGLLNEFNIPNTSAVTGVHVWDPANQVIITLADGAVYRKDATGLTILSGIVTNGGLPSIAAMNESNMFIASGCQMIMISPTTTAGGAQYLPQGLMSSTGLTPVPASVTSTPPQSVTHVILFNNYLICNDGQNQQAVWYSQAFLPGQIPVFFIDLAAGSSGYFSADYRPDDVSALALLKNQIVVFGLDSEESWYNGSITGFPFLRIDNSQLDVGLIAPYSVLTVDDTTYFLTRNRKVAALSSSRGLSFVSRDIQRDLDNLVVANDCISCLITDNGQTFAVFNFPTDRKTYVLNTNKNRWSQWRYLTASAMRFNTSAYVRDITFGVANTTVTDTPTSAVSTVINGTSTDWTNPTNIQGIYNPGAVTHRTNSAAAAQSYFLRALGFGLAIPAGTTIKGVKVTIKFLDSSINAQCFGANILGDMGYPGEVWDNSKTFTAQTMRLVLNGSVIATKTVSDALNNKDTVSWGGPTDLWGMTTLDYLTLNSAVFGLDFSFSSTGAPSGAGVVITAIVLEVTYLNVGALSTVGATWAGDSTTGAVHSLSATQYSDEVVKGTKVSIDVEIESGTITYKTFNNKFVSSFDIRCATGSGPINLSMKDGDNSFSTPMRVKINDGIAQSGQLGSYRSRRYKITHSLDTPFVFIEGEENATLGSS